MPLIDKSSYMLGLQCHKLLWTLFHAPTSIPAPDKSALAMFERGREVGRLAQQLFPCGINLTHAAPRFQQAVVLAQQALQSRQPLFEAAFTADRAFAVVDMLVPVGINRWDLYEVKSSSGAKALYLQDIAFQVRVIRDAGVNVRRAILVYINNSYVRDSDIEVDALFVRQDVTEQVDKLLAGVEDNVERMQVVIAANDCPEVPIGLHCDKPYTCPLHGQCWAHVPDHSVFTLVRAGAKAFRLMERGILDLRDVPDDFKLTPKQTIQQRAVISGQPHIDRAAMKAFFDRLKYPLHYLDFETVGSGIPVYYNSRPFEAVPFQFSLHIQQAPAAALEHHGYLADGVGDPRPEFMHRLRAAVGEKGSVIVYNAAFEKGVLTGCAELLPEFRSWVTGVKRRVIDLHLPFKRFDYYHPAQRGSTSIKTVMPALTACGYDELEIREGAAASNEFMRVTFGDVPDEERQRVRRQLEEYCGRDTEGMARIVEALHKLTRC